MEYGLKRLFLAAMLALGGFSLFSQRDAEGRPMPVAITQKIDSACLLTDGLQVQSVSYEWKPYCGYDCVVPLEPAKCFTEILASDIVFAYSLTANEPTCCLGCFEQIDKSSDIVADGKSGLRISNCYHWSEPCSCYLVINERNYLGKYLFANTNQLCASTDSFLPWCFPDVRKSKKEKAETKTSPERPKREKFPFNPETMIAIINTNEEDE